MFSISSAAAAFRFIVILLPDPAYITEYIEDPFDTVRIVGDSNLTARVQWRNYSYITCMISDIHIILICIFIRKNLQQYSLRGNISAFLHTGYTLGHRLGGLDAIPLRLSGGSTGIHAR